MRDRVRIRLIISVSVSIRIIANCLLAGKSEK